MKKNILLFLSAILLISCECPFEEMRRPEYQNSYYSGRSSNDVFHSDILIGGWQCDYPMIITGIGEMVGTQPNIKHEMKWITFTSDRLCDITLQPVGNIERRVYTFSWGYDGSTLRFTRNGKTIIFKVSGFIYPELYLKDSYGKYTIVKRRVAGCI